jgi:hypothetical protein
LLFRDHWYDIGFVRARRNAYIGGVGISGNLQMGMRGGFVKSESNTAHDSSHRFWTK